MRKILCAWLLLFVVQVFDGTKWNDYSSHTSEVDAQHQVTILEGRGIDPANIQIVEKDHIDATQ